MSARPLVLISSVEMKREGYGGIVYIESETWFSAREHAIAGHWDRGGSFVEGPGWDSAIDAISWGRRRAPEVYLRVHAVRHEYRYVKAGELVVRLHAPNNSGYRIYDAGETAWDSVPGRVLDANLVRWPGARDMRDADVEVDYGGTVYLVQEPPEDWAGGAGYVARWERLNDGVPELAEVAGPTWDGDFDDVVAWGRERAPYVLIHHAFMHRYESAGELDLPGLEIPRYETSDEALARVLKEAPPQGAGYYLHASEVESAVFPMPDDFLPAGGFPAQQDE